MGIASSVHFLGLVDDVDGILFGSDLYVSPSWAESFPYSVLEAMGAARSIVATDVGGVGEAIEDGVTGRLVSPRDARALADAMIDLLVNREWGRSLGRAARERVIARFSSKAMVEGTIAVYGELGS
jgi:glycosyltransferase involved in cell wall biosynthesis